MKKTRFLLVQVIKPHYHSDEALVNMRETEALVATWGGVVVERLVQHRVKPHPATYVGAGKLGQIKKIVKEKKIDVVVMNDLARSGQVFRLEKELWDVNRRIRVWDRVELILEIFEKHASTREAKLQIELARIDHVGPRLYGLGRTELSRQAGGIGTRGLGETNIERERRLVKKRRQQVVRELGRLSGKKRERIHKRREAGLGPVALVGYTSAGKTSLFNRLTGKKKETRADLFTTLDTVVGRMKTADRRVSVVVSDTIGFIEDLPPKLVEAFRSTLMEALDAKLVLLVIDGADGDGERKMEVASRILEELGVGKVWVVMNKCDLVAAELRINLKAQIVKRLGKDEGGEVMLVSAKTGEGIEALKRAVVEELGGIS